MAGSRPLEEYRSQNTVTNAFLGGIVGIVLGFLPFSPVIGGFVAGYLQDADRSAAIRVGALAGLVVFVPLLFGLGLLFLFVIGGIAYGVPRASILFLLVALVGLVLFVLYTVGLSAAGGYLGAIVAEDYAK